MKIEDVLPFAFPFRIGERKCTRRTPISEEACLQRYLRLAMRQFTTGDVCLMINQMYGRILSFRSGVMICRSRVSSESLGEKLANFTKDDIPLDGSTDPAVEAFLKVINTSCTAIRQTPERASAAWKGYFAYIDHLGLNSVFLTVTPDDLRRFRILLYILAGLASTQTFPNQ